MIAAKRVILGAGVRFSYESPTGRLAAVIDRGYFVYLMLRMPVLLVYNNGHLSLKTA